MPKKRAPLIVAGIPVELDAPGLEWRERVNRRVPVWVASREARARGYLPRLVRLHADLTNIEQLQAMAARCRVLSAEQDKWLADGALVDKRPIFDGTLHSLIDCYQRDRLSPYFRVKQNTRRVYDDWCRTLDGMFGKRRLDKLVGQDFRRWFDEIAKPGRHGGAPRLRLARSCIRSMLMILLRYGVEIGIPVCLRLANALEIMDLRVSPQVMDDWHEKKRGTAPMTFAHASAIVTAGLARGSIRHRSVAIGVAAQFEFTIAQIDVIGWWDKIDRARAIPAGAVMRPGHWWRDGLRYEDFLPNMVLDMARSKNGRQGVFDVREYPLFLRALAAVPEAERRGPVVIDDAGLPFNRRHYADLYRELADEAKVPREVWNMHARHGGATEANDAGVAIEDTSMHLQHSNIQTTKRHYIKPGVASSRRVARARVASRDKKESA